MAIYVHTSLSTHANLASALGLGLGHSRIGLVRTVLLQSYWAKENTYVHVTTSTTILRLTNCKKEKVLTQDQTFLNTEGVI